VPRFDDVPELDIHLMDRPDLASAGADRAKNRLLLAAGYEKRDAQAAFDHWISHCDAHLGPSV